MLPLKFEIWVVHAPMSRASHAGEAPDESEQADSKREEPDSGTALMRPLVGQS